ncbi:hypothetical protein [Halopseudomonas laoshanensis]|uniref:hypothetical protein n=1 Tax=Halopseudomonas laoshanensis TaxID=2268758 RepID=UPI0037369B88
MTKHAPTKTMRRPEVAALARQLRRQNPKLSDREALTLAKHEATSLQMDATEFQPNYVPPAKPTARKPQFRTFVLRIDNMEQAKPFLDQVSGAFSERSSIPGITVTAMSMEDEISRVEQLEAHL